MVDGKCVVTTHLRLEFAYYTHKSAIDCNNLQRAKTPVYLVFLGKTECSDSGGGSFKSFRPDFNTEQLVALIRGELFLLG